MVPLTTWARFLSRAREGCHAIKGLVARQRVAGRSVTYGENLEVVAENLRHMGDFAQQARRHASGVAEELKKAREAYEKISDSSDPKVLKEAKEAMEKITETARAAGKEADEAEAVLKGAVEEARQKGFVVSGVVVMGGEEHSRSYVEVAVDGVISGLETAGNVADSVTNTVAGVVDKTVEVGTFGAIPKLGTDIVTIERRIEEQMVAEGVVAPLAAVGSHVVVPLVTGVDKYLVSPGIALVGAAAEAASQAVNAVSVSPVSLSLSFKESEVREPRFVSYSYVPDQELTSNGVSLKQTSQAKNDIWAKAAESSATIPPSVQPKLSLGG